MKKSLLFFVALMLFGVMQAQVKQSFISESFDGQSLPQGWSIVGPGTSNWAISSTNKAGGSPNELFLNWDPTFNGVSRVVSPAYDLSGAETFIVSFKHCLDNYTGANTIGIATSSDGTTWNSIWEQAYSVSQAYSIQEELTSPDAGNPNVKFCIYFSGNSYNINGWYFDDIEIFTQNENDIKLERINIDDVIASGEYTISFNVKNMGTTKIESIAVRAEIIADGCVPTEITETINTNINSFESAELSLEETFFFQSGMNYSVILHITEINGITDDDESNNVFEKIINVAMGSAQRIPLIEHFSSSTCGPCVTPNAQMLTLTQNNPGKYTYTKYQMNWPGAGDIYYTNEGGIRRTYYGVSFVPDIYFDGKSSGVVNQAMLDEHYEQPAFADIRGAFTVEGNTINIVADFMSFVRLENVNAFISINEKETTGNVGSNGEQSFHHVFMKMLENAYGNSTTIEAGEYQRYEFSYDLSSTNVEEMDDLEVSLWLQNPSTKEIYNSHFAYEYTDHCYPVQNLQYDAENYMEIEELEISFEAPEAGTPEAYNIYVNGELVAENYTELTYSSAELAEGLHNGLRNSVTVVALYEDGKSSVGVSTIVENGTNVKDIEQETSSYNIYPNPAKDFVKVSGNNISSVNIYNSIGVLVDRFEVRNDNIRISTQNYKSGVYFINVEDNTGNSYTNKLIITK